MSQKKTVWFEVEEEETIEDCLKRMAAEGYTVAGQKRRAAIYRSEWGICSSTATY